MKYVAKSCPKQYIMQGFSWFGQLGNLWKND